MSLVIICTLHAALEGAFSIHMCHPGSAQAESNRAASLTEENIEKQLADLGCDMVEWR